MSTICSDPDVGEPCPERMRESFRIDFRGENHEDVHWLRRHFHQLFRRLRHRKNPTRRRTRKAGDLGHFDLLLGDKEVDDLQHVLQLVHHLRHKDVKSRQPRSDVSKLLHSVPQNLLPRPDLVGAVRPGAPELRHAIIVEKEVLRAGLLGGFQNFDV